MNAKIKLNNKADKINLDMKSFKQVLDKYEIPYTIGTLQEVEKTIEMLDKIMNDIFFNNQTSEDG